MYESFENIFRPVSPVTCLCDKSGKIHRHYIGRRNGTDNQVKYAIRKYKATIPNWESKGYRAISMRKKLLDPNTNKQINIPDDESVAPSYLLNVIAYIQTNFKNCCKEVQLPKEIQAKVTIEQNVQEHTHKHYDHEFPHLISSKYYMKRFIREANEENNQLISDDNWEVYQTQMKIIKSANQNRLDMMNDTILSHFVSEYYYFVNKDYF